MTVDAPRLSRGAPQFLGSGAPATAPDQNSMMTWANGAIDRVATTIPDLNTVTDDSPLYEGKRSAVLTCPGAIFVFTAGSWVMHGIAYFADATARTAAIAAPATGMRTRLATKLYDERYSGRAWRASGASWFPVMPASVGGSGVTLGGDGRVSFATAATINVNGVFSADFEVYRRHLVVKNSSASSFLTEALRAGGVDITTGYDRVNMQAQNVTASSAPTVNGADTAMLLGNFGRRQSVDSQYDFPFLAGVETLVRADSFSTDVPGTAAVMTRASAAWLQRATTQIDGVTVKANTGTIDGWMTFEGGFLG